MMRSKKPTCLSAAHAIFSMLSMGLWAIAICFGQGLPAHAQDYQELKLNDDYFSESLKPILVDIRDQPAKSLDQAARFKELTDAEKGDINRRFRDVRTRLNEDRRNVDQLLRDGGDIADPVIAKYFEGYVFPQMTLLENVGELGTLRGDFLKAYVSNRVPNQTRQRFIETICLPNLKTIYQNQQLHPAARVNAVVLLGLLDVSTGVRSASQPPAPFAGALVELINVYQTNDPTLMAAAWAGIQRHVIIDAASGGNQIPAPQKTQIKQTALALLQNAAGQADDLDPNLLYWLQRQSMQMMAALGTQADLETLLVIMNDAQRPFWLRYDAMESIGKLNLSQASNQTVKGLVQFVADGIEDEAKLLESFRQDLIYSNMLFQDLDLEQTEIDWNAAPGRPRGGLGGGNPGGDRGGRGDGGRGMGMGMGMGEGGEMGGLGEGGEMGGLGGAGLGGMGEGDRGGRPGGAGGGRPGGGRPGGGLGGGLPGANRTAIEIKHVELPVYQLQVARRKVKALAFTAKQILMPGPPSQAQANGLYSIAEDKDLVSSIAADLDTFLKDSDVGIVNLNERTRSARPGRGLAEEEEDKEILTDKMIKLFARAANGFRQKAGIELKPATADQSQEAESDTDPADLEGGESANDDN